MNKPNRLRYLTYSLCKNQREQESGSLNQGELNQGELLDLLLIVLADRYGMLLGGLEGQNQDSQLYRRLVDCSAASWLVSNRDIVLGLKINSSVKYYRVRLGWKHAALTYLKGCQNSLSS